MTRWSRSRLGAWVARLFGTAPGASPRPDARSSLSAGPGSRDDEPAPRPTHATRRPPAALVTLTGYAACQGTDEDAAEALAALSGTPHERAAIDAVLRAGRERALPDDVAVAIARLLSRRGDDDDALAALASASSVAALSLRAELLAGRGETARACAELERLLARDIRAPGIADRLSVLRASLGLAPPSSTGEHARDATLMTARAPGAFRVVAEAGRGGAATVYEAEDERLGRRIALKVYHRPELVRDQLEREASVAAALAGPGIVRVHDASFDEGWIALSWAPRSLRELVASRDARWLLPHATWLAALVRALARVHEASFVHGDVKPGNVLFAAPGTPVLTDFGLARRPGEPAGGGTPGYMSPERLASGSSGTAAPDDDVYGLGRILEDALSAVGDGGDPSLRPLVLRLLGEGRPRDARALDDASI